MTYLALAIGHHLLAFALFAVLVAERTMMSGMISPDAVRRLRPLDAAYGGLAVSLVVVGFLRVFFGVKGADFYLANPLFWAKIGAFVAVALLSIVPTVRVLAWNRRLASDPHFSPDAGEAGKVRGFLTAELAVFPLIPIFAAVMAMGYGLS